MTITVDTHLPKSTPRLPKQNKRETDVSSVAQKSVHFATTATCAAFDLASREWSSVEVNANDTQQLGHRPGEGNRAGAFNRTGLQVAYLKGAKNGKAAEDRSKCPPLTSDECLAQSYFNGELLRLETKISYLEERLNGSRGKPLSQEKLTLYERALNNLKQSKLLRDLRAYEAQLPQTQRLSQPIAPLQEEKPLPPSSTPPQADRKPQRKATQKKGLIEPMCELLSSLFSGEIGRLLRSARHA